MTTLYAYESIANILCSMGLDVVLECPNSSCKSRGRVRACLDKTAFCMTISPDGKVEWSISECMQRFAKTMKSELTKHEISGVRETAEELHDKYLLTNKHPATITLLRELIAAIDK